MECINTKPVGREQKYTAHVGHIDCCEERGGGFSKDEAAMEQTIHSLSLPLTEMMRRRIYMRVILQTNPNTSPCIVQTHFVVLDVR